VLKVRVQPAQRLSRNNHTCGARCSRTLCFIWRHR
jgi:hypothetical protein